MASINDITTEIRNAVLGKDVRGNIANGIEAINTEVVSTTARQGELEIKQDSLEERQDIIDLNESGRVAAESSRVTEFDTIKDDYDTYKNVMISESNVAALQNNININASQLANIAINLRSLGATGVDGENITNYLNQALALNVNTIIIPNKQAILGSNSVNNAGYGHTDGKEKVIKSENSTILTGTYEIRNAVLQNVFSIDRYKQDENNDMKMLQLPPKNVGDMTTSHVLVTKVDTTLNKFHIFQKSGDRYLKYLFQDNVGTVPDSKGGQYDLFRCLGVQDIQKVFVVKKTYKDKSANVGYSVTYPTTDNIGEDLTAFEKIIYPKTSKTYKSEVGTGIGLLKVPANEYVQFDLLNDTQKPIFKFNIAFYTHTNYSDNIGIYILNNDATYSKLKTISAKNNISSGVMVIDVDIPHEAVAQKNITVKIANEGTVDFMMFGLNFFELKDYSGQEVDYYWAYGTSREYLNSNGANDYAIRRKTDDVFYGSYHGGEFRDFLKFRGTKNDYSAFTLNGFEIVENFYIQQSTQIKDGSTILLNTISKFYFPKNGTLGFQCSFYDGNFDVNNMRSVMTCTHPDFKYIYEPYYTNLDTFTGSITGDQFYLPLTQGSIHQATTDKFNIITRFCCPKDAKTKFYVSKVATYNKVYLETYQDRILKYLTICSEKDFFYTQ